MKAHMYFAGRYRCIICRLNKPEGFPSKNSIKYGNKELHHYGLDVQICTDCLKKGGLYNEL